MPGQIRKKWAFSSSWLMPHASWELNWDNARKGSWRQRWKRWAWKGWDKKVRAGQARIGLWKALSEGSDCAGPLALVQTKSAHVLRLGCYTIPEQSRLGVTIRRARVEWEQRESDNARGRMGGREAGPQFKVGERGQASPWQLASRHWRIG
jgi:hypothetical protein